MRNKADNIPKRLAIMRSCSWPLRIGDYNVQEVGFARALRKRGWRVDIYSRMELNFGDLGNLSGVGEEYVKVIDGYNLPGRQIISRKALEAALLGPYDILQVHDDWPLMNQVGALAARLTGKSVVLWQGVYRDFEGYKKVFQKCHDQTIGRTLRVLASFVFTKTTAAKQYLLDKGHRNVELLPVGLDFECLGASKQVSEIENFRKKYDRIILYVGLLEPRRNIGFLIDVFAAVRRSKPSTGLIVVGDGPDVHLVHSALGSEIGDAILYLPRLTQRQVVTAYKNSDVLALPSSYEIFGMVLLEALYFGVPVVASREAGPQDIISNDDLGYCVDMKVDSWKTSILSCFETAWVEKKKEFRHRKIVEKYSWDAIADTYIRIVSGTEL